MKAFEFKTKIKNNQIQIPLRIQSELKTNQDRDVRVIANATKLNNISSIKGLLKRII
jgi:hypothetical protein